MNFRRKRKTAKKSFDPPCIFQIAFSVFHAQKSCASPLSVRPSSSVSPEPPVCYFPLLRPAVGQNRFRFAPAISKKLLFNIFPLCIYILFFEKFVFLLSFILLYHPPKLCYSNCGKETLVPNPFLMGVSLTEPLQTGALLPDGASVSPQKAWRKPCFFPFRISPCCLRFIYCHVPCNAKYFVIY